MKLARLVIVMINIDEIGALDKRIEILIDGEYEDEIGLSHKGSEPVFKHKIWARIEPTRGRVYFEQFKDKTEDFVKITIRYREGITSGMYVRYKNTVYDINTVINPYMANVKLELMCVERKLKADED